MKNLEAMQEEAMPGQGPAENYASWETVDNLPSGERVLYEAFDELEKTRQAKETYANMINYHRSLGQDRVIPGLEAASEELNKDLKIEIKKFSEKLFKAEGLIVDVQNGDVQPGHVIGLEYLDYIPDKLIGRASVGTSTMNLYLTLDKENTTRDGLPRIVATRASGHQQ